MLYETLPALLIPLPEDIRRMEDHGDYARARRMIGLRVGNESLPEALRTRLQLEAQMLERVPGDYPYTFDAALELLQKEIRDFTAEELDAAIDAGRVSWILLDGGLRLHRLFLDTLVKVRPELEPRIIDPERLRYKRENFAILDAVIREMKQHGGAARRWHMRHALQIRPEWERPGELIRVDLPLPVEYDCVKNFRLLDCGPVPGQVASPDAAQRTITFEKKLSPGEAFFAEYSFEVHMPCHDLDPARAGGGVPGCEKLSRDSEINLPPRLRMSTLYAIGQALPNGGRVALAHLRDRNRFNHGSLPALRPRRIRWGAVLGACRREFRLCRRPIRGNRRRKIRAGIGGRSRRG